MIYHIGFEKSIDRERRKKNFFIKGKLFFLLLKRQDKPYQRKIDDIFVDVKRKEFY